jgi:hypothetical protein
MNNLNNKDNKDNKQNKNEIKRIIQYQKKVSLIDCYITKNINKLVKNKKELNFVKNNNFLLGITNKLGKNSLNILLENSNFKVLKELIEDDVRILRFKNRNEKNLLMTLISYEEFYSLILKVLTSEKNKIIDNYFQFKIKVLSEEDINNNTVVDLCIELININLGTETNKLIPIIKILKKIYELDKEEVFLVITKLCRDINNKDILLKILEYINPNNLDIFPDLNNNTCVDYLIYENNFKTLKFLIERIEHIYFINFEENSILLLLDNLDEDIKITPEIIELIFKILSKSNINKLKDMYNENILFKLLRLFKFNKKTLKGFIEYFDIFEQNVNGDNIYEILIEKYKTDVYEILDNTYLIDSQIPYTKNEKLKIITINYDFDIKYYLKQTHYGVFISDSLHNMIYTYIILKRNKLIIPYKHQSQNEYLNNLNNLNASNNDKDINGTIKFYFHNFNSWISHLVIWKEKTNYYINSDLINWLKQNSGLQRFYYIKLSIIATNKIQGNIRHANLILIDNLKKTVERFEPYGEIYFSNCLELNNVLEDEIANKIGYKFIFVQSYPGFQIRSDEFEDKNKSYGDPGGFCLAWCFLYLEMKLYYENVVLEKLKKTIKDEQIINELESSEQVIKLINNYIINKFEYDFPNLKTDEQQNLYMTFIRYYARGLDKAKNELIRDYGLNVSTIYHLDLDDKIHKKIIYNLNKDIKSINKFSNNL